MTANDRLPFGWWNWVNKVLALILVPTLCSAITLACWTYIPRADWWTRSILSVGVITCFVISFTIVYNVTRNRRVYLQHIMLHTRSLGAALIAVSAITDAISALAWFIIGLPLAGPSLFYDTLGTLSARSLDFCVVSWSCGLAIGQVGEAVVTAFASREASLRRRAALTAAIWFALVVALPVVRSLTSGR